MCFSVWFFCVVFRACVCLNHQVTFHSPVPPFPSLSLYLCICVCVCVRVTTTAIITIQEEKAAFEELKAKTEGLCKLMKEVLDDKVDKVVVSPRLADSPCVLVTGACVPYITHV